MNKALGEWAAIAVGMAFGLTTLASAGCASTTSQAPGASSANDESSAEGDGESVPNAVVHKTGSGTVSARLGPPGGTLELNDGPRVEIPPGSITGGQEFVLKIGEKSTAFKNQESQKSVGPIFVFSPDVTAADGRTITVSIPLGAYPEGWGDVAIAYEVSEGEVVGAEDSIRTKWQYENAKLSGGRAVAELQQVNGLRMQFVLTNLEAQ